MQLEGIHHLTAITSDAPGNLAFLPKLGFAARERDGSTRMMCRLTICFTPTEKQPPAPTSRSLIGPPKPELRGTRHIACTGFFAWRGNRRCNIGSSGCRAECPRISDVVERDGRGRLAFEDPEGSRLSLTADDGRITPIIKSPVPAEHHDPAGWGRSPSVSGIGSNRACVNRGDGNGAWCEKYTFAPQPTAATPSQPCMYSEMGKGGPAAELHVAVEPGLRPGRTGAGGVPSCGVSRSRLSEEYDQWFKRLQPIWACIRAARRPILFPQPVFPRTARILFELGQPMGRALHRMRTWTIWARNCATAVFGNRPQANRSGMKPL